MLARRSPLLAMALLAAGSGVDAFLMSPSSTNRNVLAVSTTSRPAFVVSAAAARRSTPSSTQQFLFGPKVETPDEGDLAKYSSLPPEKFEALSEYIRLWADLFVDESKQRMGLTTPVKIFPSTSSDDDAVDEGGVTASSGVRIVFQKTKTGDKYKSGKDEKKEAAERDDPKKKKKDAKLEGGVQVLVEKLDGGDMVVRARRCDFDEDTMIKEMSEETVLSELKRAMDVWRRDNKK